MNGADARLTGILTDSGPTAVSLSDMGFEPGRQLVAYVLVSSDCSYCKQPDTKLAIAALRDRFRTNTSNGYRTATVVGVDLDLNLEVGLNYLRSIGLDQFDEISVGKSWLNENLVRLVWRNKAAPPSVPQVIIVSRDAGRPFAWLLTTLAAHSTQIAISIYSTDACFKKNDLGDGEVRFSSLFEHWRITT